MAGIFPDQPPKKIAYGVDENGALVPIKVEGDGKILVVVSPPTNPNQAQFSEDIDFLSADSPATFNLNALLSGNGTEFTFINDGPGDINIQYSSDGAAYSPNARVQCGDVVKVSLDDIHSIRSTHIEDSAYRIWAS